MDYSEAGNSLLADLVTKYGGGGWGGNVNKMDCLYTHPHTGASLYVGGWEAAEDLSLLQEAEVTHSQHIRSVMKALIDDISVLDVRCQFPETPDP